MRRVLFTSLYLLSSLLFAAEEVVVTPARNSQSITEVVPSVIVIDKETIQQSVSTDIADLLRWHAGIDISRTGGFGQQTSAFIRGANSNHTSVLINGIKMNSATTGAPALETINTAAIERIEIIKGPRSTVYGSEAIGGVINVITTPSNPKTGAAIQASNSRYATQEQSIDLQYADDFIRADVMFNHFDSNGFPAATTSDTDHGHDSDTIDVNVSAQFGGHELSLGYWEAEGNTEYDSFGQDLDQDRKNSVLQAKYDHRFSENWKSTISISKTKDEIRQNQTNFIGDEDFAFTDRIVYDWENDIYFKHHVLTFGAAKTDEKTESLSFGTSYKEDTDIYSLYLHDQFNFNKHSLFTSTRFTDHEDFDTAFTWNLEYAYQWLSNIKAFASIGTGFRAPDSNARFGFGGNDELDEENSRSIELGVHYDISPSTHTSLRLFENKFDDLIETVLIDPATFTFENQNVDDAENRGIEISFAHQTKHWNFTIEGILQNPRNDTDDSQLLRRAKRSITSSLRYRHDKYFVLVNALATSEREDFGDVELPRYGLVNVSAGVHIPYVTLAVKMDNIFDKEYELASGFNTPGQSLFAEAEIKFTK